jgi:hypothetical protein
MCIASITLHHLFLFHVPSEQSASPQITAAHWSVLPPVRVITQSYFISNPAAPACDECDVSYNPTIAVLTPECFTYSSIHQTWMLLLRGVFKNLSFTAEGWALYFKNLDLTAEEWALYFKNLDLTAEEWALYFNNLSLSVEGWALYFKHLSLTAEEWALYVRNFSLTVEDWGLCFNNLSLTAEGWALSRT